MPRAFLCVATAFAAAVASIPASAAEISFSGSAAATASPAPSSSCAPLFQGVATGSGTSSYGAFSYSHIACTTGATGPVTGSYVIDFGADQFSGLFAGTSAATPTPGLFDLLFTYDILAGTGRFADATGQFGQIGSVDVRGGPPSRLTLNYSAVPEPASWALMLLGFAAVGGALRLNRRKGGATKDDKDGHPDHWTSSMRRVR
nr:PEPxxWA-CTERM sorting domain-containing protein [uncultured Sphingomonas sp.]